MKVLLIKSQNMKIALVLIFIACIPGHAQRLTYVWQESNGPIKGPQTEFVETHSGTVLIGMQTGGIMRSTDSGSTWSQSNSGITNLEIRSVGLTALGHPFCANGAGIIYSSSNDGITWREVGALQRASMQCIAGALGGWFAWEVGDAVYFSHDGSSWQTVYAMKGVSSVYSFATDDFGTMYVGTNADGMYRSSDNGSTWEHVVNAPVRILTILPRTTNLSYAIADETLSPMRTGRLISSADGIFWEDVIISHSSSHQRVFNVTAQNEFVWVNDLMEGGLISTNNGASWREVLFLSGETYLGFYRSAHFFTDGRMLSSSEIGLYLHPPDFSARIRTYPFVHTDMVISLFGTFGKVIVASGSSGTYLTTDAGRSWQPHMQFQTFRNRLQDVTVYGADLYALQKEIVGWSGHESGVMRSSDEGVTWDYIQKFPTETVLSFAIGWNGIMAVATFDSLFIGIDDEWSSTSPPEMLESVVFARGDRIIGVSKKQIHLTDDRGLAWVTINPGVSAVGKIVNIEPDILYIGVANLYSTDNGESWNQANINGTTGSLRQAIRRGNGSIYLATQNGIFVSDSIDGMFAPLTDPVPNGGVTQILHLDEDTLLIGTNGYGFYRGIPSTENAVPPLPALARAFSIAPNPSNGAFEVALEFDAPTAFTMRIVNTLGQTVYTATVSERRVSYRGSIALNSPPGVYFFLLESGGRYDYKSVVVTP